MVQSGTERMLGRFGVVSDEIHTDPSVAFRVARELGMRFVDLNSLWGKAVTDLSDDEVDRVAKLAKEHRIQVYMVAGATFKALKVEGLTPAELLKSPGFAEHMEMLDRSLEIAQALDAPYARVFSFRWAHMDGAGNPSPRYPSGGEIPPKTFGAVVAGLQAACELAEKYGVRLGLENVRSCHANSGRNTRVIMDAVGHEAIKVVWDPGNAYVSGESTPFPDGYEAVRPYMAHVHVKDAAVVDPSSGLTQWRRVGDGAVDYVGQFRALLRDGFDDVLCLETHWKPDGLSKEDASRASFQGLLDARAKALKSHAV